jgi:Na+-translocating ferredoxin:NAD+ oxidoreductase RnfE subunit
LLALLVVETVLVLLSVQSVYPDISNLLTLVVKLAHPTVILVLKPLLLVMLPPVPFVLPPIT